MSDAEHEDSPQMVALDAHLEEHGCGTGGTRSPNYVGGFFHCPAAKALWDALPDYEQVILG